MDKTQGKEGEQEEEKEKRKTKRRKRKGKRRRRSKRRPIVTHPLEFIGSELGV